MIMLVVAICFIFMPVNKYALIGYASAGALLFSLFIVYDTQVGACRYSKLRI